MSAIGSYYVCKIKNLETTVTNINQVSDGATWPIDSIIIDRYARNSLLYEGRHGESMAGTKSISRIATWNRSI